MRLPTRAHRWACISVLLALLGTLGAAIAPAAESKVVELASGRYAGREWAFNVSGPKDERCLGLQTLGGGWSSEGTVCEEEVPIRRFWSSGFGDAAENDASTIAVNLTSPRVASLRLLLGHPGPHRHASTWRFLHTRSPSPQQLEEAGLESPFNFVVFTGIGNLCVEKVRAFDRSGHRLAKLSLPCEY
jgi:hypothetical protein